MSTDGNGAPASSTGVKCVILSSSCCMDPIQEQDQRRCRDLMAVKGVPVREVDGADGEQHEERNRLWGISGHRGKYPQVFIEKKDGDMEFVGLWSDVENLNEACDIPAEILAANPQIKTFNVVFGGLVAAADPAATN